MENVLMNNSGMRLAAFIALIAAVLTCAFACPSSKEKAPESASTPVPLPGAAPVSPDDPAEAPEPAIWSVEGVSPGQPVMLASSGTSVLSFTFTLAPACHYNEGEPLRITLENAGGAVVTGAWCRDDKPGNVPGKVDFSSSGLSPDAKGELKFDFEANYCSDEGFCVRRPEKITIPYIAAPGGKSAWTVSFILDPNL